MLILKDTDTITKPLDFIKHTIEVLDALLPEPHRFAYPGGGGVFTGAEKRKLGNLESQKTLLEYIAS